MEKDVIEHLPILPGLEEEVHVVHHIDVDTFLLVLVAIDLVQFQVVFGKLQHHAVVGVEDVGNTTLMDAIDGHHIGEGMDTATVGTGQENREVAEGDARLDELLIDVAMVNAGT